MLPDNFIKTIQHHLKHIVRLCRVDKVDDQHALQSLDISLTNDEAVQGADRHQEYGFTSHPDGGVGLCLAIGQHRWVIGVENDSRPRALAPGEVMFYHQNGDRIHLKNGNEVQVSTTTLTVDANHSQFNGDVSCAGDFACNGDINCDGDVDCDGTVTGRSDVVAGSIKLKTHVHGSSSRQPRNS